MELLEELRWGGNSPTYYVECKDCDFKKEVWGGVESMCNVSSLMWKAEHEMYSGHTCIRMKSYEGSKLELIKEEEDEEYF